MPMTLQRSLTRTRYPEGLSRRAPGMCETETDTVNADLLACLKQ